MLIYYIILSRAAGAKEDDTADEASIRLAKPCRSPAGQQAACVCAAARARAKSLALKPNSQRLYAARRPA